jgi:hypothetical protein
MTSPDDGLERFEAVLGAISKITAGEEGLVGARCPKCNASDFAKGSDVFDEARARLEEPSGESQAARYGGLTDLQLIEKFRPPERRSVLGRAIIVAVPLSAAAFYVYHRFGATVGQIAIGVALVTTVIVLMTRARRLSDEYYARRGRWNKLYICRRCGQLVSS